MRLRLCAIGGRRGGAGGGVASSRNSRSISGSSRSSSRDGRVVEVVVAVLVVVAVVHVCRDQEYERMISCSYTCLESLPKKIKKAPGMPGRFFF